MKRLLPLLLCTTFVLTGCATSAEVTSNKDETFTETLDELLVIVQVDPPHEDLGDAFQESIAAELASVGVSVQTRRISALELDEAAVIRAAEASPYPIVMTFTQSGSGKDVRSGMVPSAMPGGGMMTLTSSSNEYAFEASIYHMNLDKRVWRAHVDAKEDGTYGTQGKSGRKVAKKLAEKLQEDGLIVPAASAGSSRNPAATEKK